MNLANNIKKIVKNTIRSLGLDVVRRQKNPRETLLGLRELPFQTIVDIGANKGQFAMKISEFFPKAKLYCFEPLPEPFEALSAWSESRKGRVELFNLAIGDKNKEVEIYLHQNHSPSSSLLKSTDLLEDLFPFTKIQNRICVKQTTLDDIFYEKGLKLSHEVLIKVDVQGYEDRVIAGGSKLFANASACIMEVGIDPLYKNQAVFRDLVTMLDKLGYHYAGNLDQTYGNDGHCIFLDAVFLNSV